MPVAFVARAKNLEALVVFIDDAGKAISKMPEASLEKSIRDVLDFKGRFKENYVLYVNTSRSITKRLVLVGVGKTDSLTSHHWRVLGGSVTSFLKNLGIVKKIGVIIPQLRAHSSESIIEALTQGQILSQVGFDQLKTEREEDKSKKFEKLGFEYFVSNFSDIRSVEVAEHHAEVIAENVNWARHLILTPANMLYPDELVKRTQEMVKKSPSRSKIKAQYWGAKELSRNQFGGVIGVGQGSEHPPRFIILEYLQGKASDSPIILVGKGVTFDSGGLSLKPPAGQETMKYDMAGSASVLAAFKTITDLQLKCHLVCLVPTAENMPSGTAIRPGDVLKMASGTTVEVLNTDAEGRLLLADALFYATTHYKPKAVIDVATLTGSCALALGEAATGLYTNSKKLEAALLETATKVRENLWPLPAFEDFYAPLIKSDISDLKNTAGREAGASTASIFLKHFVRNDAPWAHLDIAGCGWYDSPRDFITMKGPSGIPIRTMVEFIETFGNKSL